jgi:hypothetical protein
MYFNYRPRFQPETIAHGFNLGKRIVYFNVPTVKTVGYGIVFILYQTPL